jgi:hypothetical protein
MAALATIFDYMKSFASDLGDRIVQSYQPLHQPGDCEAEAPPSPSAGFGDYGHGEVPHRFQSG